MAVDKVLNLTPLASIPPPAIFSTNEIQVIKDIHKKSTYGREMEDMLDDLIVIGLNFIEEDFKAYEKIAKVQVKLSTTVNGLDRDLKLWSECIQDLKLMSETDVQVLLANKVFDDVKKNFSRQWVYSIEWKIKVLEESIGELRNMLQK